MGRGEALPQEWEIYSLTKEFWGKKCLSCWNIWEIDTASWAAKPWGLTTSYFVHFGRRTRKEKSHSCHLLWPRKAASQIPKKSQVLIPKQGILVHAVTPCRASSSGHSNKSGQTSKRPCGILNTRKTSGSKPVTSLLFAQVPDHSTNLHMPKSWADQKFPLQTMCSACWTPPATAYLHPGKGNQLETPVRQRGF